MVLVKIYLKSRNIIQFECKSFNVDQNSCGGIRGYAFEGLKGEVPYVDLYNIEAITVTELGVINEF